MKPADAALAVTVATVWGLAFVATELALQSFSPAQLAAIRFVLAAAPVVFVARPPVSWTTLIVLGTFLFTGQFLFLFFGFEAGMPPGLASVVTHTQALMTIVIAALLLGERPNASQAVGVLIAVTGVVLIAMSIGGDLTYLGFAFTLLGALSWAIANILLKRIQGIDMFALIVWLCLVPPIPAFVLSLMLGDTPNLADAVLGASVVSIAATLYLGLVSTTVAYAVWARLLGKYPAVSVTPFALLAPCAGTLGAFVVFGETFDALRGGGMILTMIGVAVTVVQFRKN